MRSFAATFVLMICCALAPYTASASQDRSPKHRIPAARPRPVRARIRARRRDRRLRAEPDQRRRLPASGSGNHHRTRSHSHVPEDDLCAAAHGAHRAAPGRWPGFGGRLARLHVRLAGRGHRAEERAVGDEVRPLHRDVEEARRRLAGGGIPASREQRPARSCSGRCADRRWRGGGRATRSPGGAAPGDCDRRLALCGSRASTRATPSRSPATTCGSR